MFSHSTLVPGALVTDVPADLLNAVGALTMVYAFRYGEAIVVSPLTNAGAPLITALLSLALLGIVLAFLAAALLDIEAEEPA